MPLYANQIKAVLARLADNPTALAAAEKLAKAGQKGDITGAEALLHENLFGFQPVLSTAQERVERDLPGKIGIVEDGVVKHELPLAKPKTNYMMALAPAAGTMDVGAQMNPLQPLGYAAQKYKDAKDAVLGKFAALTDLTPGGAQDYRDRAKTISGAILDPANAVPGAGGLIAPIAEEALASQAKPEVNAPNKLTEEDFEKPKKN